MAMIRSTRRATPIVLFCFFAVTVSLVPGDRSEAAKLSLRFDDPRGDGVPTSSNPTPVIDVRDMTLNFDNVTGTYDIVWRAYPEHPFDDRFRINVLLFNPDAVGGSLPPVDGIPQSPGFFVDNVNDFELSAPQTEITLRGRSQVLTRWNLGDPVAASGGSFPEMSDFATGLIALFAPDNPGELIGTSVLGGTFSGFDLDIQTVIVAEPTCCCIGVIGILAAGVLRPRFRHAES